VTHPTLIKWPSRSRPALVEAMLPKWNVPGVHFLFSIDGDDPCLPQYWQLLNERRNVTIRIGHSKGKVEAINDGVAETDWEFLILAADDFVPQRADYADVLRDTLYRAFPDGDGVVHVNDGRNGKALNTCPILGRKYFNRTGRLYSDEFVALWCDNEETEVSEKLGLVVYVPDVILKHEWVNATGRDPLHLRNEALYEQDRRTFVRRKANGFPNPQRLAIA
jgi:hypothetical protein